MANPNSEEVTIERDGKKFTASYKLKNMITVTVTLPDGTESFALLRPGGGSPRALAIHILGDYVAKQLAAEKKRAEEKKGK